MQTSWEFYDKRFYGVHLRLIWAYSPSTKLYWLSAQLAADTTRPVLHKIHRSKSLLLRGRPTEDISDKIQTGIKK